MEHTSDGDTSDDDSGPIRCKGDSRTGSAERNPLQALPVAETKGYHPLGRRRARLSTSSQPMYAWPRGAEKGGKVVNGVVFVTPLWRLLMPFFFTAAFPSDDCSPSPRFAFHPGSLDFGSELFAAGSLGHSGLVDFAMLVLWTLTASWYTAVTKFCAIRLVHGIPSADKF
jgi:hypothetical protein